MNNFFGVGTGLATYDNRRHVNMIYAIFMQYRIVAGGQSFMTMFANFLKSAYNEEERAYYVRDHYLNSTEFGFLGYLFSRFNLSIEEFFTIMSGRTFLDKEIKTPAGYNAEQNWRLIIHMLYTSLCVSDEHKRYEKQIITSTIIPVVSGMCSVNMNADKYHILTTELNTCLNKGLRDFCDLPKIESTIISKIM